MLEGNEEARRGRRLEAQVGHKMPQTQKKRTKKNNVHGKGKLWQSL